MLKRFLFGVIVIACSPVSAKEAAFVGAGTRTCGQFAQDYAQNPSYVENMYFGWAQGYLTGRNLSRASENEPMRDLAAKPVESIKLELRMHCDDHPLQSYLEAVEAFYGTLPEQPAHQ